MSFVKEWTVCICITLLVSVVFSLLTPKGRMAGFYKMTISVFIFVSFLYPLKNFNIDLSDLKNEFSIQDIETSNEKSVEAMISSQIKSALSSENIENANVSCDVQIRDNLIEVEDVVVSVSDEYDTENVKSIIFDNLGINAEVHRVGD